MNLFELDKKYFLVHCIAADARMGAGIATEFVKKYPYIKRLRQTDNNIGTCIKIKQVMNLITKGVSQGKPTYNSLIKSLIDCKRMCLEEDIKFLAMPKIGCGLDRLSWGTVSSMIKEIFDDTDIEILVCHM